MVALVFAYCAGSEPSNSNVKDRIEYQLAAIDANRIISEDDPSIEMYELAFDRLAGKCGNDRQRFGDMSVSVLNMLESDGVDATALGLINATHAAIPEGEYYPDCSEWLALAGAAHYYEQ